MFSECPFSFLIAPIHPPTRAEEKDGACQNIGFLSPLQAMVRFCLSLFTLATPMLLQSSSGIKHHVRIVLSIRVENQSQRQQHIFNSCWNPRIPLNLLLHLGLDSRSRFLQAVGFVYESWHR